MVKYHDNALFLLIQGPAEQLSGVQKAALMTNSAQER